LPLLTDNDTECLSPLAITVIISRQGNSLFAPIDSGPSSESSWGAEAGREALLQLDQFLRLAGEGRAQQKQVVAIGSFRLGIASVQRLGPDQRSGLGRRPFRITRAGDDAFYRHMIG